MSHPYENLPAKCLWYKAMTNLAPGSINPVSSSFIDNSKTKIATMGSCFAQHLAKFIKKNGFNYYVTEGQPSNISDPDNLYGYGIFTARYGNVYTVRQANQLIYRAYSEFIPSDAIWKKGDHFVDAFRPNIQSNGFLTEAELIKDREIHFRAVRRMFETTDVLIFTLGLTEAWESTVDGASYPVAPGVSGGEYNEKKYRFINYSVNEVISDLDSFVNRLKKINPGVQILLTVSPVPLIATKENRHVLVSTTVSKSILRVAADEVERSYDFVTYFPSYEIITSAANNGKYFDADLRDVTSLGVSHVMRVFKDEFLDQYDSNANNYQENNLFSKESNDIICDEELILNALSINSTSNS